jgi:hypothetical protein
MANALNYSLSQKPRFQGSGWPRFSQDRIITSTGLRDLNSVVLFSIGFPFQFKNNISVSLFLFYKIESWKQIFISHLVYF